MGVGVGGESWGLQGLYLFRSKRFTNLIRMVWIGLLSASCDYGDDTLSKLLGY